MSKIYMEFILVKAIDYVEFRNPYKLLPRLYMRSIAQVRVFLCCSKIKFLFCVWLCNFRTFLKILKVRTFVS